jgi:hypothetical protein
VRRNPSNLLLKASDSFRCGVAAVVEGRQRS